MADPDTDAETSLLIAQLALEDIAHISTAHKGKARADAPLSDAELALQLQADDMHAIMQLVLDMRFARSLDCALGSDGRYLDAARIVEQGAEDDRRAALALQNGGALPAQSDAQRRLEDPVFRLPE